MPGPEPRGRWSTLTQAEHAGELARVVDEAVHGVDAIGAGVARLHERPLDPGHALDDIPRETAPRRARTARRPGDRRRARPAVPCRGSRRRPACAASRRAGKRASPATRSHLLLAGGAPGVGRAEPRGTARAGPRLPLVEEARQRLERGRVQAVVASRASRDSPPSARRSRRSSGRARVPATGCPKSSSHSSTRAGSALLGTAHRARDVARPAGRRDPRIAREGHGHSPRPEVPRGRKGSPPGRVPQQDGREAVPFVRHRALLLARAVPDDPAQRLRARAGPRARRAAPLASPLSRDAWMAAESPTGTSTSVTPPEPIAPRSTASASPSHLA